MSLKDNAQRYKRLHNWYYVFRDSAHPDKIELNFRLRQLIIKECLENAIKGEPLPSVIIGALNDSMSNALSGHYDLLTSPLNLKRGGQEKHRVEKTMMRIAVSYVELCKKNTFSRSNPIKFICDNYGVSTSAVQNWYNNPRFQEWVNDPFPFSSQTAAEQAIEVTGEIYKNNTKAHKKA